MLLIAKPFQLAFDFFLFLFRLGLLERGLEFGKLLVQVFLSVGEFAESIEHLTHFALFLLFFAGWLRLLLCFVAIFFLFQFQVIQLLLASLLRSTLLALLLLLLLTCDLEFTSTQFQQSTISRLFGHHRRVQRSCVVVLASFAEFQDGFLHLRADCVSVCFGLFVFQFLGQFF